MLIVRRVGTFSKSVDKRSKRTPQVQGSLINARMCHDNTMNEQEQEWIEKLNKEGYTHVHVCRNAPNAKFDEHTHEHHTVHVVSQGELALAEGDQVTVYHKGDRFEIPAGATHAIQCGPKGCAIIVGVKKVE